MTGKDRIAWDLLVSMCGGDMMITEAFAEATILVADAELKRLREVVEWYADEILWADADVRVTADGVERKYTSLADSDRGEFARVALKATVKEER